MISEIIRRIEFLKDAQEEHTEARNAVVDLALKLGIDEKLVNNDTRVARAYLEGFKKGMRHERN